MGRKRVKKWDKITFGDDDRISHLPDDILVHIISFLSLKEAVGTSVLSSRWLNLWKHTPCLNFDAHISLEKIAQGSDICTAKRWKYVKWVHSIIGKHKAVALKEFRICLNLTQSARKGVTRWLKFALARHVQRLELDFSPQNEPDNEYLKFRSQVKYYSFPEEFLTQNSGEASISRPPSGSSRVDFKSLKALSLKCVDVTDEAIEFLLRNCPLLEKLVVHETFKLSNLEVCGPSLVLRHLELTSCRLRSVKVSAPNLTSLIGPDIKELLLENVPKLVEVSIDCRYKLDRLKEILLVYSCCIFQLEILTLKLTYNLEQEIVCSVFLELPKLKKLVIKKSFGRGVESIMGVTPLIRASPYLQEFVLELSLWTPSSLDGEVSTVKFAHEHLKVFKFIGYYGHAGEIELVRYIIENCIVLEKVIIDTCYPSDYRGYQKSRAEKDIVKQGLEAEIPQHIELVIL